MMTHSTQESKQSASRDLQLACLQIAVCMLAIVGYFGPWIPNKAAALTVTGYELSEFAKFFPQVQSGVVPVTRGLFIIPLIATAVSIGLLVSGAVDSFFIRLLAIAFSILLLLALLPPFDYILTPQYRLQLLLTAGGLLLTPLTILAPQLSRRARSILTAFLALAGAALPLWQFLLLRPLVSGLYKTSVGLGWGLLLCTGSLTALFLSHALVSTYAE